MTRHCCSIWNLRVYTLVLRVSRWVLLSLRGLFGDIWLVKLTAIKKKRNASKFNTRHWHEFGSQIYSIILDVSDIPLTSTHPLPCPSYEIRYLHVSLHLSGCWNKNLHLALICHSRAPLHHYEWIRITHDRSLPLCLSNSRLPRESKPSLPTPPLPRPPRPPLGPPRPRNGLSPTALM